MPSNPRVDAAFREIAPSIFEAWLKAAPDRPDDTCAILIPIPHGVIEHRDRPALEAVIRAMFMVSEAEVKDSIDPRFPVQGIRVVGLSWGRYQKIAAQIREAEAALA